MKKFVNLVTVIIIFATVFTSCEKIEINQEPIEQTVSDPVLTKILNFKKKIENPDNIKSDEMMSVDSAVWYIEALLNYNYSVITETTQIYTQMFLDSIYSNIDVSGDWLTFNDVLQIYKEFQKKIETDLKQINTDKKHVDLVNVTFKDGNFISYLYYRFEEDNKEVTPPIYYKITDDWEWGNKYGNCSHTILNRDVTDEMDTWLKRNVPPLYNVIWTNVHIYGEDDGYDDVVHFTTCDSLYSDLFNSHNKLYVSVYQDSFHEPTLFLARYPGFHYNYHHCIDANGANNDCQTLIYLWHLLDQRIFVPNNLRIKMLDVEYINDYVQDEIGDIYTYHLHTFQVVCGQPVSNIQY